MYLSTEKEESGHRHPGGACFYPSEMRTDIHHLSRLSWGVGGTILCTVPILRAPQLELFHGSSMLSHPTPLGIEC